MKKNILKYLLLLPAFLLFFISCRNEDENVNNISVKITEVGEHDTHGGGTIQAGEELHLQAELLAPNKIETVNVTVALKTTPDKPIVNEKFSDYKGQINATFHKHLDIPEDATPGDYVVIMIVTDATGQSKTEKAALKIEKNDGTSAPIKIESLGHDGHGHPGKEFNIDAHIKVENPVKELKVSIHNEKNPELKYEKIFPEYVGQTHIDFENKITIPANFTVGDYHFEIKVTDNTGKSISASKDVEIKN